MKKLLGVLLLILVAYVGWRGWRGAGGGTAADRGQAVFYNRVWVDHMPSTQTEMADVFLAVTEQPLGIFDTRSAFKGDWEIFRYEARGDGEIDLLFPQSREKRRASYRAWPCSDKPSFDFCLEMTGGRRAKKYYSRRGWEVGSLDEVREVEHFVMEAAPAAR